jgi:hypothetical protein
MLVGLRDAWLAVVARDDPGEYGRGEAVMLPSAARLTLSWDGAYRAAYSDDGIARGVRAGGVGAELRLAGADPERLVALGLWSRGADGSYHDGLPRDGRAYALGYVVDTLDGAAYSREYPVFWIERLRLGDCVTRGAARGVCEWIITGALLEPRRADIPWWSARRIGGEDGAEGEEEGEIAGQP